MNKSDLRRQLKAARNSVPLPLRKQAGQGAVRLALRAGLLLRARRVAFYLPQYAEFDIRPLLNRALKMGRACYLPVLPPRGRVMRFGALRPESVLSPNRYGILEPRDARACAARQMDLLLMPLLGFDLAGHRLGMGGGYYDATLAYLRHRRYWRKPRLIGVAYECQRIDRLPHDTWDIPLDGVLTEKQLYRFLGRTQ